MTMRSWMCQLFTRPVTRTIRKAPLRIRPVLERLEDRLAPATFVDNGTTLNLVLNTANTNAAIVSSGTSYTLTLTGDTWTGTNDANVTGNGTATLTVTSAGIAAFTNQISLLDAGAGGDSVNFNNSGANAYSDNFTVAFTNAGAGDITFNGASSFTGTAAALTASTTGAVTIASGATITQAAGTLSLTAGGSLTAAVDNGTAEITAPTITLAGGTIGTSATDRVEVTATTLLNAATTNGNMVLGNVGNLALGSLNAGTAFIDLEVAGAITDGNGGAGAPNLTAADGVNLTTTGSNSAIGTSALPIRTAIGVLTATTNDGGVFIADSNGPGLAINSVLAKEGGKAAFPDTLPDGSTEIVLDGGTFQTGTDDVAVTATGPIVLVGTVTAPHAATITSSGGSIVEGTTVGDNVIARSVTLGASGAIGQDSLPILLAVESFDADTTNGNIYLSELIAGTAASVVAGGAGSNVSVTAASTNLGIGTITAPGTVTVQATQGALLSGPSMDITGQTVDLTGKSAIGTVVDPVRVTTGNLMATVTGANVPIEIDNTTGLDSVAATSNAGDVNITFTGGSLVFTSSTGLLTASGAAVTFDNTGGDVMLGVVDTGSSNVSVSASGAITADANPATVELSGNMATLSAGTGIGVSGSEIDTNVATLNATTTSGDIFIVQAANPLTVSATSAGYSNPSLMTGSDIDVSTTAGDMTVGTISALGTVTLNAGGAILAANTSGVNLFADTLDLNAANGIGASGAVLLTSVSTLTADGGAGGGLFLSNNKTLILTSAAATGGAVSITALGDLDLGTVTAAGQTVTLTATGALIDPSGPALNVTALSATLSGSMIGAPGDDLETMVSTVTASATGGSIYIHDLGTGSLTLTATAVGQGADIDFTSDGSIVLKTVTAKGNTVTLNSTAPGGMITTAIPQPTINITAQTLDIVATGGIGTAATPLQVLVAQVAAADGGTPGVFMVDAGPLAITKTALQATGSGTLTFDAASITILDMGGTTVSLAPGRSLMLKTETGPIVFINPADTIQTTGTETITIEAGTIAGSGGEAVVGNLTTAGGKILVSADGSITIGLLNAGTGNVTVQSAHGIIIKGNGPSQLNVIAGTTTLSGSAPTARQLELDEENKIAAAAAASAEAAAEQTSADAFQSQVPTINTAVATGQAMVTSDQQAFNTAKENTNIANSVLIGLQVSVLVAQAFKIAFDVANLFAEPIAAAAQALPATGDFGANEVKAVIVDAKIAADIVLLALNAAILVDTQVLNVLRGIQGTAQAQLFADESTLGLAMVTQSAFMESNAIAQAAAGNSLLESETEAVVSTQAIAARDQANVIGSPSAPIGLQVAGTINVTAGPTDSYLQVTGATTVDQIQTTGSVTLISTGAVTAGSGVPNVLATGLNVSAVGGIGTAANPLVTSVGTLNASNTTSGDIEISNTAPTPAGLNITGISNTGGNVSITEGSPLTVSGNITSAAAISLTAAPEPLPATGDDLTVDPGVTIQSTGSSVSLSAGDNVVVPSGATIEANSTISITANANDDPAGESVTVAGTLIATSASIGVDAGALGNETFNITPSALTPITVDGGSDADGSNTLNFNAGGLAVTISGDTITAAGRKAVTFTNIQFVNIINAGGGGSITLTASGTGDALNLLGTGQGAGTFTLNGGVPISFTGTNTFTFNSTGTNDTAAITPFATPLLPWNVAVTVAGGTGTNGIIYNGVSAVSENITIQPSAYQAGQVIDTNAATGTSIAVINYTNNSNITVNGSSTAGTAGDTDKLTVAAPAGRATVSEANRIVTVTTPTSLGTLALEQVTLAADVQEVNLMGGSGPDTFQITPAAGIQYTSDGNLDNLVVNVIGATDAANDALVIQSAGGGPLTNPNEFVVINRGSTPNSGYVSINTAGVEWPPINYINIQAVSVNAPGNQVSTGTLQSNLLISGVAISGQTVVGASQSVPIPGQTGVSASENGMTVTITTPSPHGLQEGYSVTISGFTGSAAGYNGTFVVTSVPTLTTFTYTSINGLHDATGGSELPVPVTPEPVTITTQSPDGLQAGDSVTISGFTGSAAGYNGTFVVTSALTPTTFTYTPVTLAALPTVTNPTGVSEVPIFNLFATEPQTSQGFAQGPTPLVNSLTITVVDKPPANATDFPVFAALNITADENPGLYTVVGDQTGIAAISQVIVTDNPVVAGQPAATATVQLIFAQPLLDDRYTLTINDNVVDPAGNQLDGASNASDPGTPIFPSGSNGLPANFVARFTVDSRPHIGTNNTVSQGSGQQQLDINGNGFWDPVNAVDAVNSDKAFSFGNSTDTIFSGNFAPTGQSGTGFDELGAYGQVNGQWRWLLSFNNVAQPDYSVVSLMNGGNLTPVAGHFNPNINADEIALFDGNGNWYIDYNHTNNVGGPGTLVVRDGLQGIPVVGDFDGSGHIEFATYQPNKGLWTFDLNPFGVHDIVTLQSSLPNINGAVPVAADMNGDGVTDIGLYVPQTGSDDAEFQTAGFYWLVSKGTPVVGTINTLAHAFNPSPFSNDLYYSFGNGYDVPLAGHWDPPLTTGPGGSTGTALEIVANRGQLVAQGGAVTISRNTLRVTDPDHPNAPVSYTITALPANGELLLSGNPATVGTTFTQSDINLGHVRYENDGSATVADSFEFTAADSNGGTLWPTTVAITVKLVNHAPTLNGNGTALTSIPEDTRQSAGDAVSVIVGDTITDADSGALVGIAIIGATGGHGTWQYSTNGGTTWSAFGVVSANQALLLPDTDRVRFVPAANFNGVVSLVYRAWDQTSGIAGRKANLSSSKSVGGSTAFSAATAMATLTVTPVNHAPTLVANSHPVVRGGEWGTTASALLAAAGAHDVDAPTVFGIAVTATTGDGWQYSTDGGTTWLDLGVVAASGVLLLDGAARLRRSPGSTGPATLTFRAWDGTQGVAGETADLSAIDSVGGSTAFSQVSVKTVWKS